jgi:branched-chain amino acid transport system permease protein
MAMVLLLQQLMNGIALGTTYALVALGFTMVYGLLFFINLPHGEVMMVGTYLAFAALSLGAPAWVAVLVALAGAAVLGIVVEKLAYSRLEHARRLAPVLSALGLVLIMQNAVRVIMGPQSYSFPSLLGARSVFLFGMRMTSSIVWSIVVAVVLLAVLEWFSRYTDTGLAIRAASQDRDAAVLMGISPRRVVAVTFAIGSALAAAAGVLLGARYGAINPFMGFPVMLKAFAACVLGGIGNVRGAVLGSMVIGIAEVFAGAYIGGVYQDGVAFLVLILVLLFRPTGLLRGRTESAV